MIYSLLAARVLICLCRRTKFFSGHKTEVWDFDLIGEENFLVTGSTDNEIRLWELMHNAAYGERDAEENATEVCFLPVLQQVCSLQCVGSNEALGKRIVSSFTILVQQLEMW